MLYSMHFVWVYNTYQRQLKHSNFSGVKKGMKNYFLIILSLLLLGSSCSNVGDTAPSFKLKTADGYVLNSNNLQDKIVVVNVWATWCPTCLQEMPALNRLQAKYAEDTSIVFLGLCEEGANDMNQILKRFPFNYHQVANAGKYSDKLQTRVVKTFPQNLIINNKFEIVFEVSDGSFDIFRSLDEKITELIKNREKNISS